MMRALLMFLLLHVLTCFGGNALRTEIINGKKTKKNSMLYMASVQSMESHVCGGFLISENFVLTAAHCENSKPTSVVLGTHNLKKVDNATMRYAVKRCKHPAYQSISKGNDIMLLKLSRKATLGKKGIKPVQLPTQDMKLKENKKCRVAGWGFTKTGGELTNYLQEADVPIINWKSCLKEWGKIPANVICAGGKKTKKGFCQGDSGGPLVCGKVAVGVVSYNNNENCNYPDVPNIYTEISRFLPWIKEILKKQSCHLGEIIKGQKVPENLMLYMASVQNNKGVHICGGFLISEDFVLTAAHCDRQSPTSVVLGTHNLKKVDDGRMRYNVTRCKNPSFENERSGNDIMLLKLSKKAQWDKRVQPVPLPKTEIKIKNKAKCRVAGWGFTKTGGKVEDVLRVVEVPFVDLKICKTEWKEIRFDLPDNVICAGGYGTDKGFCKGDSGGPLVCGGTAVGVVSFNMWRNCDYPNVPNVYTDISKYRQWIKETLKKKDC